MLLLLMEVCKVELRSRSARTAVYLLQMTKCWFQGVRKQLVTLICPDKLSRM